MLSKIDEELWRSHVAPPAAMIGPFTLRRHRRRKKLPPPAENRTNLLPRPKRNHLTGHCVNSYHVLNCAGSARLWGQALVDISG